MRFPKGAWRGIGFFALGLCLLVHGSHWRRAATAGIPSTLKPTLLSNAGVVRPSFSLAPEPLAIPQPTKRAHAPKSSLSEHHSATGSQFSLPTPSPARGVKMYSALPLRFEANQGQADPRVKFLSHGEGYTLFLTPNEAVLSVVDPGKNAESAHLSHAESAREPHRQPAGLHVKFSGATAPAKVTGKNPLPSRTNYLLGSDPTEWHTGVPNYAGVRYHGLYPGIDAVFHGDQQRLEFDFEVAPGADPSQAELQIAGAEQLGVNARGNIVLRIADETEVTLDKPKLIQEIAGRRREVAGRAGPFVAMQTELSTHRICTETMRRMHVMHEMHNPCDFPSA